MTPDHVAADGDVTRRRDAGLSFARCRISMRIGSTPSERQRADNCGFRCLEEILEVQSAIR